jgi:uncharacterized protein (DUF58 family)
MFLSMLTRRGTVMAVTGIALLLTWVLFGERELMAGGLIALVGVGIGVAKVAWDRTEAHVTRTINPPQAFAGEPVTVQLRIEPTSHATNVRIEDVVAGRPSALFAVERFRPGRPLLAKYTFVPEKRGVHEVGPARMSVGDPLGVAHQATTGTDIDRIVVYPPIGALEGLPIARGSDSGANAGFARTTGGDEFFALREYRQGDDLRRVHWPATARRDELMIRQLQDPQNTAVMVVFDPRSDIYSSPEAFEDAVSGVTSIYRHLFQAGVGPVLGIPGKGVTRREDFDKGMEWLAEAGQQPITDFAGAMRQIDQQVGGGLLIVVTGEPDDNLLVGLRNVQRSFNRRMAFSFGSESAASPQFLPVPTLESLGSVWQKGLEQAWAIARSG